MLRVPRFINLQSRGALATEGPQQPAAGHAALRAPSARRLGVTPGRTREHAHCVPGQASTPATEASSGVTAEQARGDRVVESTLTRLLCHPREIRLGFQNKGFCKQSVQNKAFLTENKRRRNILTKPEEAHFSPGRLTGSQGHVLALTSRTLRPRRRCPARWPPVPRPHRS